MIGLLNLVPASSLGGHKLIVGLLWCANGSEKKARRVSRRVGLGWAAVDLPSAAFLLLQRRHLGLAVVALAASFLVQNRVPLRRRALASRKLRAAPTNGEQQGEHDGQQDDQHTVGHGTTLGRRRRPIWTMGESPPRRSASI